MLLDFSFWLGDTSLSLFMVENFWNVPIAQVIHIAAIGIGFASLLMMTLRVYEKAGMTQPVSANAARYLPWMWWSLLVILLSGLLMITAEPIRNMVNAVFWIKMIALVGTILVTLRFQTSVKAKALAGGAGYVASSGTRTTGLALVILWCFIMFCGRWIAYVPV
ncbi:hypothetical protein M3P36_06840 [Altererythrobacter sp. KTW20L]|uniref:DUF6644 family protein n=1 Tax=Altererythrobacter sp. KTW20L TaxID=2942210 RepID=UPI0020BF2491|nr:DUF6644 family protein [Altererythrobacter sp. KTW20L]MCL6250760.1 hypothetical protein [Altererythrobacter sp. KTW20L]